LSGLASEKRILADNYGSGAAIGQSLESGIDFLIVAGL
jgi:hypothetical protein